MSAEICLFPHLCPSLCWLHSQPGFPRIELLQAYIALAHKPDGKRSVFVVVVVVSIVSIEVLVLVLTGLS